MPQVRNKKIALKDGSFLDYDHANQQNVRRGIILRFAKGAAALMRIDRVEDEGHSVRIYGMNILGEHHAAYAHNCVKATDADIKTFKSMKFDRRYSYLQNEDDGVLA